MKQIVIVTRLFAKLLTSVSHTKLGNKRARELRRICVYVLRSARRLDLVAWQSRTLRSPPQGRRVTNFAPYASSSKNCASDPAITLLPYKSFTTLDTSPETRWRVPLPLPSLPFTPTPAISLSFILALRFFHPTAPCPIIHSFILLRRVSTPPFADYYRNYDNRNH